MTGGTDIQDGLGIVADCIQNSEREILDEIDEVDDAGNRIVGYVFTHGGDKQLLTYSKQGSHFFIVQYDYNVVADVASTQRIQEEVPEVPDGPVEIEVELDEKDLQEAERQVAQINAGRDREAKQRVHMKLIKLLSHPDCGYEIVNELNGPHGFSLNKKQFVYESGYRPSEFDSACQTLISLGMYPKEFLQKVFNVEIDFDQSAVGGDVEGPPPGTRGFQ